MELGIKEKINNESLTLIEFINTNCEPCAMIEPTLQQVKNSIGKRVDIFVYNLKDVPSIAEDFGITTVPMLVLFHSGEVLWRTSEVLSKQEIIDKVLNSI